MRIKIRPNQFNHMRCWTVPIEDQCCPSISMLDKFDQTGYDLCELEQKYAEVNTDIVTNMRYRKSIRKEWLDFDLVDRGAHINHADLYERKGFSGYALEQINHWAPCCPILYKLSKIKGKWGIDISIDYADNKGNVFELFHYEWDDFELGSVQDKKEQIEKILLDTDWDDVALKKLARKDEWAHLNFFEQSKWTTKFLGLPEERFKLNPWNL